jgi:hypothetical protein
VHGTSSLTNRTQPSFLTSNPLQTTTQQKHEQFPLLVARAHKPCVRRRRGGGSAPRPLTRAGPRRAPPLFTPAGSGPPLPLRARRSACSLKAPAHYSARASAPAGRRTCAFCFSAFQHALQSVCCARPLGSPLLASALAPPGPRLFGAHGAAPPPHSHARGLSCLLAESGANPFLPPEPAPGPASPLCSRPPSVPRAPSARPPTSVCRCARVPAVRWRGRRRGSASGAARAKGGPHAS